MVTLPVWLVVPLLIWGITGLIFIAFLLLELAKDSLDERAYRTLTRKHDIAESYITDFGPQSPPLPEEDEIRYLADLPMSTALVLTPRRSTTMSKSTATVASLVTALQGKAKEFGVSEATLNAFLKEQGVGSTEHHTVTITVEGDSFAEVRDRAVRVIKTYGPTATEATFPATSDGVHFEHTKTVEVTA